MPQPLIECIPNFSEGQRTAVIDALVDAIARVDGVRVLDRTSDADHHRSVITYVGAPDAVLEAAFDAIKLAASLIDLDQHQGQHPRIGATDVVPLVPIQDISMDDCVRLAHELGQRVGSELELPVYLYENAAVRPERRNLADVRRGGYEGLRDVINTPQRYPDYGPTTIGKAGAVAIGARQALIAFNAYLNTDRVEIAQQIARAIRASSGGLAGVKALGLLVDDKAQVSMNLVDYKRTPLYRVMELLRIEAAQRGVQVIRTELIGLIPQDALLESAAWYLQLQDYRHDMVLEHRLSKAP